MATLHSLLSSSDEVTRLQLDLAIEKTLREGANKAAERWQNAHFALEQESEAEIKALQARVAELEEALRPFAFEEMGVPPDDEDESLVELDVLIGDIRKARALVKE